MGVLGRFPFRHSLKQLKFSFSHDKSLFHSSNLLLNHVRHVPPGAINWYPGHMQKGLKAIYSRLVEVDVVIEIHDARIPLTGRCQFIKDTGQVSLSSQPLIIFCVRLDRIFY